MTKRGLSVDCSSLRLRFAPLYKLAGGRRAGLAVLVVVCFAALSMGAARLKTGTFSRVWERITSTQACHDCSQRSAAKPAATQSSAGTFTNFDVTGAGTTALEGTFGVSINASGEVAGIYITSGNVSHGFVRAANGTISTFDAPNAGTGKNQGTFPISIDVDGNIAGMYADTSNVYHGFIRNSSGTITEFNAPGAGTSGHRGTSPISINAGVITGPYVTGSDVTTSVWHGFVRATNGGITTIDVPGAGTGDKQGTQPTSINASGVITGMYTDSNSVYHGFIDGNGTFTNPIDAPGSVATVPTSIDAAGDIAGVYADSTGLMHGFVRTASGTITTFSAPGASTTPPGSGKGIKIDGTIAGSINTTASVAGFYTDTNKAGHGYIRASNGTFTSPLDDPDAGTGAMEGTISMSINDSGIVTGTYADTNDVFHGFVFTPNPSTITLTPAALSFGSQAIDIHSAAKVVTVKNAGSATVDISSITASGAFAVSANTCGATLAPGKTCKVSVTFTPTSLGSETGLLSVNDSAYNSPQTAALSGTGIAQAELTPARATYAKQKVGTTSAPKTFTLTNELSVALTGIAISTTGDFNAKTTTCGTTLAAKGKCTISVTFTPKATGARTGELSVKDSANNSPQGASLTGTGD
ncbi:MAG: choice-of-anchor D domain-containing protein [Terriglobales bacterium]|jgi:predicted membrane protein